MIEQAQCTFRAEVRPRWSDIEEDLWTCPHFSQEDSDKCIFHQPVSEKENKEIISVLLDLINNDKKFSDYYDNGKRQKQFIKAEFDELDLSYTKLSPKDNYEIDFRGSEIETLNLSNAQIENTITFEDAAISGACRIWPGHFKGEVSFARVRFHGQVALIGSTFEDELWFTDAEFYDDSQLAMLHASSSRVAWFGRTFFHSNARFEGSEFELATFAGAKFEQSVTFDNCSFSNGRFSGASFYDDVSFENVQCEGALLFTEPGPREPVHSFIEDYRDPDDPSGVIFESGVSFCDSVINESIKISSSECRDECSLDNVVAEEGIQIDATKFFDDFSMLSASVGDVTFLNNECSREISFESTEFQSLEIFSIEKQQENKRMVDLSKTNINSGTLDCSGYLFNLSEANIGDIRLSPESTDDLLSHYQFLKISFDNFGFPSYKRELSKSDWDIASVYKCETNQKSPRVLEETFLKAKNDAYRVGDIQSGSEFHYRELFYRGRRHIFDKRGISGYTRWLLNRLYLLVCGYGEKPYRVIIAFSLSVLSVWVGTDSPLSLIILVLPFFSALFVFTLTRTLGG